MLQWIALVFVGLSNGVDARWLRVEERTLANVEKRTLDQLLSKESRFGSLHALSSLLLAGPARFSKPLHSSSPTWSAQHGVPSVSHRLAGRALVMSESSASSSPGADEVQSLEWSALRRNTIVGLALAGALLLLDATTQSSFCTSETCGAILGGQYGNIAGIPLTYFGTIAYVTVAALAVVSNRKFVLALGSDRTMNVSVQKILLTVVAGMAAFSGYLMLLLGFVIKASCTYCITSAALSATLCALSWWGLTPSSEAGLNVKRRAAVLGSVAALSHYVVTASAANEEEDTSYSEFRKALSTKTSPKIVESSSQRAIAIAKRLRSLDATMYGAYWCSHCFDQKVTLGKEAMSMLRYVECGEDAKNSQRPLCVERDIKGYPTWIIDGEEFKGEKDLDDLEEILRRWK